MPHDRREKSPVGNVKRAREAGEKNFLKMPTFVESVKFERECPPNTIRLVRAGGFYRAFNHSAWLFQCCIAEYKVVRKFVKQLKEDVFMIGFPETKLHEAIGERKWVKTDRGYDVSLGEDEFQDESAYATWLTTVEAELPSQADYATLPLAGVDAEREVLRRLLEFPLESKTMVECVVFLSELRTLLNNK